MYSYHYIKYFSFGLYVLFCYIVSEKFLSYKSNFSWKVSESNFILSPS